MAKKIKKSTQGVKVKVSKTKRRLRNSNMNYRELKRVAVSMGMPFPDVVSSDVNGLMGYINSSTEKVDRSLIAKYDEWMDKQLEALGYKEDDPMRHFQLRLGYISEEKNNIKQTLKPLPKKPKDPKKIKAPKEKNEMGLWKGTKKSLTYECAKKGDSLAKTIKKVLEKFPDAKEVSIKQWHKRALKEIEANEK